MNETFRNALQKRAELTLNAQSQLSTVDQETRVQIQTAEREANKRIIAAKAEAESIRMLADAKVYAAQKDAEAAKLLESTPLAAQLRIMGAQTEIAKALGDKTVVLDGSATGFNLGNFSMRNGPNNMMMFNGANNTNPAVDNQAKPAMSVINK